jgi:anti-sigma regulatory factor (Ser/Thr protein kinase)
MSIFSTSEFRREIPANLAVVEDVCVGARRWAVSMHLPNRFAVELLLREALINAAAHGCGCDSSKRITCVLRLRPGRVVIAVHDQGPGFDWRAACARIPDQDECSGRGMTILQQYAHRLRFNQRGNSLVMIKRWTREGTR